VIGQPDFDSQALVSEGLFFGNREHLLRFMRFRAGSSSRVPRGKCTTRDIKRIGARSNRGILATTKNRQGGIKLFFRIARHDRGESRSVACNFDYYAKPVTYVEVARFPYNDVSNSLR